MSFHEPLSCHEGETDSLKLYWHTVVTDEYYIKLNNNLELNSYTGSNNMTNLKYRSLSEINVLTFMHIHAVLRKLLILKVVKQIR